MQFRLFAGGMAIALLLLGGSAVPQALEAQFRPLAPMPPEGLPVSPFMEGWYENDDGSYTISFGYLNRNEEQILHKPIGDDNYIEPEAFGGMQPTIFLPGRHRGVFAITIPQAMHEDGEDLWWYITNTNGEVHRVPGRARAEAYQLDRNPRPQGSLQPVIWFDDEDEQGSGPEGIIADETLTPSVGEPVELTIHAMDPSERDPEDPRFREAIPLRVVWFNHQGPAEVEFTRHESTPEPEESEEDEDDDMRRRGGPPGPEVVMLEEGEGTARVYATFHRPGEYLVRARVDNWQAPDSSSGDQCCWTNGYVRVIVEE
ncbi:MAG: hypothetical protein R3223_12935 [Longimicrobiales bacterium]|nr:hypothetical protein [Longimicrobiales bacterium]